MNQFSCFVREPVRPRGRPGSCCRLSVRSPEGAGGGCPPWCVHHGVTKTQRFASAIQFSETHSSVTRPGKVTISVVGVKSLGALCRVRLARCVASLWAGLLSQPSAGERGLRTFFCFSTITKKVAALCARGRRERAWSPFQGDLTSSETAGAGPAKLRAMAGRRRLSEVRTRWNVRQADSSGRGAGVRSADSGVATARVSGTPDAGPHQGPPRSPRAGVRARARCPVIRTGPVHERPAAGRASTPHTRTSGARTADRRRRRLRRRRLRRAAPVPAPSPNVRCPRMHPGPGPAGRARGGTPCPAVRQWP